MAAALMVLGLTAVFGWGSSGPVQAASYGIGGGDQGNDSLMQDSGGGDTGGGEESGGSTTPSNEPPESSQGSTAQSDVIAGLGTTPAVDKNLLDALAGIADYEVSYDTSKSRAELTPQALKDLDVEYAGDESPVAKRTAAIRQLDLVDTLANRYEIVEDEFGADSEKDFTPDDPNTTLNYYQPRGDPFVITDLIPKELRPELEGTGLDGPVDPELLGELAWANYTAMLRTIPIAVVGTMQSGPNRGCIYTIGGWGSSRWIDEGGTDNYGYFSLYCAQVSEDFVVFILSAGNSSVTRTFHVNR